MSFFDRIKKFAKNKTQSVSAIFFESSTTKQTMTASCTLRLSTKTEAIKKEINTELKAKIKKYINSPEKLLQYIQLKGVKVYRIKNAEKILSKIGEEEGFITPLKGAKAVALNAILNKSFGFTTKEMMVFDAGKADIYLIARALHKYYGFEKKLPGYEYKAQEVFKRIYNQRNKSSVLFEKCSVKDIFACKEALARDMESIKFTVELSHEYQKKEIYFFLLT